MLAWNYKAEQIDFKLSISLCMSSRCVQEVMMYTSTIRMHMSTYGRTMKSGTENSMESVGAL